MRRRLALGVACAAALAVTGCSAGFAGSPTYVTDISATINGLIATTDGGPTSYWVEYGTSQSYDHQSSHRTRTVPAKSSFLVSIPISGLSPNTNYHYRVCAQGCSDDATFTTDSPGGRSGIVYGSERGTPPRSELILINASGGAPINLTNSPSVRDFSASWSPDGRQIAYAFQHYDAQNNPVPPAPIFAMNADGTNKHPLTGSSNYHFDPAWSPDGSKVAFVGISGGPDIFVMDSNGDRQRNLTNGGPDQVQPAWSPDGTRIAYSARPGIGLADIYVMNADGSHQTPLTNTASLDESEPAWSPDGTKIAFVRGNGHEPSDIYVMNADGSGVVDVTNSTNQETSPSWSPDGSRLIFATAVDVFSMPAAGGTAVNLTNDAFPDAQPAFSPRP